MLYQQPATPARSSCNFQIRHVKVKKNKPEIHKKADDSMSTRVQNAPPSPQGGWYY